MIVPAQIPNPYVKPKWQASVGIMESVVAYNCRKYGFPRPVGAWPMWEGAGNRAIDLSGRGNHGTINGATWVGSERGVSLYFDGVNDYVDLPHSSSLNITTPITIGARIKSSTDVPSGNQTMAIVDRGEYGDPRNSMSLRVEGDGDIIRFDYEYGSGANSLASLGTTDITDNLSHYVVGIWNGSRCLAYVDGDIEGNVSCPNTPGSFDQGFCIGKDMQQPGDYSMFFEGLIDEVYIYNCALFASQVKFISDNPYFMYRLPEELYGYSPAAIGAIMNQFQKANMGADLYNGGIIA